MSRRAFIAWGIEFIGIIVIGVILAIDALGDWWVVLPILAVFGAKAWEYRLSVRERNLQVRRQLELLRSLLPYHDGVRCTYHVPVRRLWGASPRLRQAFDYIPNGGGGGYKYPANKGIIGVTYKEKGPKCENFADDDEYRHAMVNRYNYSLEELGQRTADRRSYLCYPILDDNSHVVLGLLYFDSNQSGVFTLNEQDQTWSMIRTASQVIQAQIT